jgi:hypothetical protein
MLRLISCVAGVSRFWSGCSTRARSVDPCTRNPAQHALLASRRSLRVLVVRPAIIVRAIPIRGPLPHVPQHVVQLPGNWVAFGPPGDVLFPLARNPSIQFETLQRRVERALLHPQQIVGQLLDQLRDRVCVQMAVHQYLEYQHVERTR